MRTIAVVGASLAGLRTARELRDQGYDGRVVVIGDEPHAPYDRPPLSKGFLKGTIEAKDLALGTPEDADLDVEWRLGETAVGLDPAARTITLASGEEVRADGVVIATGATARTLPGAEELSGVHTLRTLDDAVALRADLAEGVPQVVVIGAGFLGAEVAATCHQLGYPVTLVEAADIPLHGVLGRDMGRICAALHADHDVPLLCGVAVDGLLGRNGRVTGVRLADGRTLPADLVVVGIGVRPATGWLAGSGVHVDDGVVCDAGCATSVPNVVAVGDVARCHHPFTGGLLRVEHWTNALEQPATAVRTLLSGTSAAPPASAPYFWSEQYGVRIQFAGHTRPGDEVAIVEGDPASRSFVAVYRRDGRDVAVLGMNRPKLFTRLRRGLTAATPAPAS